MPKFELYEIMDKKEYKNFLLENLPDDLYKSGREMTKRFEGFEDKVYLDKKGNATIGYGTNLEIPSNRDYFDPDVLTDIKPLEEKDASRVFDISYNQSIKDAISFVGKETFDKLDETRQEILIDMSYNLGLTKLNDFNRMRTALQKGDYNIAADEMIDSDWYTDVGDRSKELVGMMRPEIKFDNQQKESLSRERTPRFSLESIEEPKFQLEDVDDKPKTMGIGETYKRMGKTIYGATLKTAAKTAESLDFYANKISEATGLQKGGLFSYLSENWDYYGDELMKEGLTQGVVQKIYAGVGSLSWSLPMIMTTIKGMGAMGKHLGLGTYAAFEAGKEGKEEVAKEFTKGVLFQGTLRATSVLPMSIQVPTMSGLFAGSTWLEGGSTEDMISSGFLGAALSMMGKAPSWQEFLAPYRDAKFTKYKTLLDKTRNSSIEYLVKKGATREQAQSVMDSYLIYKSRQSANYKIPKKQLLNALKDIKAGKDIQLDPEYIGLLSDYHKQYYGRNYESKTTTKAPESISVIKGEKVPKTEIVGKKPVTPIVKPPDALSQQAKGKSLEVYSGGSEIVKEFREPANYGTLHGKVNRLGGGIYITESAEYAKYYGKEVTKASIPKNLNLLDLTVEKDIGKSASSKIIQAFKDKELYPNKGYDGYIKDGGEKILPTDTPSNVLEKIQDILGANSSIVLEKAGYDGVKDYEITTSAMIGLDKKAQGIVYNIFNPKNVTSIWEKAQEKLSTQKQKAKIHILAKEKALLTPEGKTRPGYRKLAQSMTGKKSVKDMTLEEAELFYKSLQGLPEPTYQKGKVVPPSIPTTKKIVPAGYFEQFKFKEPSFIQWLTPQTYYAELLGVKPIVEPLEIAKQEFDLQYREYSNSIDKMDKQINKLAKTPSKEIIKSKIKNIPTQAVAQMRDWLNEYEEAPPFLTDKQRDIFNWFRSLNKTMFVMENDIRRSLDLPEIKYRKAYVRHIADNMAREMLAGKYPFPQGLKYWSQQVVGKKIYNPMEMHRKLSDTLEDMWTKDLIHATKSMVYTALKEIKMSQPLRFFNEQLGVVSRDIKTYKDLTPEQREIYNEKIVMPAKTKRWLVDYVNQVIKGQETDLDESVNNIVTKTGLGGLFNKILSPFGRTIGRKPITHTFQNMGRLTIHGVMGGLRPRQLIRNKFQLTQNLALYSIKANVKGFFPANDHMKKLMSESLFLKTYTGFEELPTSIQGKLEKLSLAPFQWSAVSNVQQTMKVSYWDTMDLITNPKYKDLGWNDPQRTYQEEKGFVYPSEEAKLLKEMEFGTGVTQYHYIPLGMPQVFRHKALVPLTRLQSWWMNHFFKFNREAISRAITGETGYGAKVPWSRRINYLKYLILGGAILNTMDYERSFLFGAAPTYLPPTAQLMLGMYLYAVGDDRKKKQAKRQIYNAIKTFIPGYLSYKDFEALWSGKKNLEQFLFYKKPQPEYKGLQ